MFIKTNHVLRAKAYQRYLDQERRDEYLKAAIWFLVGAAAVLVLW